MSNLPSIRRIDELGRIVIPKAVRGHLGVKDNDAFEVNYNRNGEIILRKYRKSWEDTVKEWGEKNTALLNRCTFYVHRDHTACFCRYHNEERAGIAKRMYKDLPNILIGKVAAYARAIGTPINKLVGWKE